MVAYNRDDRPNHFYLIEEDRLNIPDFILDSSPDEDTSIVDRLKAIINSPNYHRNL